MASVFVTGGTGYIGSRLIPLLRERGHQIKALVRPGSEKKIPAGIMGVTADPLRTNSYTREIPPADTFVHLIGVPHPSPSKAEQFRDIDFVSAGVAVKAALEAGVKHFIYLSVAHPAPVMKVFQEVRQAGEEMIAASGMSATFVRPWYVLGPGHWWPIPLLPAFWLMKKLPQTRETATRLDFVTIDQMLKTLVWAVENPASGTRVLDVPKIQELGDIRLQDN